jgi:hypothetical protein
VAGIEFTFILDLDADYDLQLELLESFRRETGIEVKTTRMPWSKAWQQLIDIATHGQGADISYVGSTWVSSLVGMNCLRPIPLWRRIENQFGQELTTIAKTILEEKDVDLDTLLTESMQSLTQRLNLTLE